MKRNNPETSHEALRSITPSQLTEIYSKILYALDKLGESTFEEIAAFLKVNPARVWKRQSELMKMGLIYRPGNKRKLKSGRNGFTWMRTMPSKTENELKELKEDQDFFTAFQNEKPRPRYVQPTLL